MYFESNFSTSKSEKSTGTANFVNWMRVMSANDGVFEMACHNGPVVVLLIWPKCVIETTGPAVVWFM